MGYAQILHAQFDGEPVASDMLGRIVYGVDKMHSMINTILNYSKVSLDKTKFRLLDMQAILQEIKQELVVSQGQNKVFISIENTPDIYGQSTMIMQVFSNLLSNAVKFSIQCPEPYVSVNGVDHGDEVQYTVADNGIGVKAADQDSIFDLFSRSDDAKGYEGSGVGLAIVKKIVKRHNGRVWIDRDPGIGTRFHILFRKRP